MEVVNDILLVFNRETYAERSLHRAIEMARYHGAKLTLFSQSESPSSTLSRKLSAAPKTKTQEAWLKEQLQLIPKDIDVVDKIAKGGLIFGTWRQILAGRHDLVIFASEDNYKLCECA